MSFCVARLQAQRLVELSLSRGEFVALQQNETQIVVGLRESWIAANEFAKNRLSAGQVIFLAQNEAELHSGVSVFGVETFA